MTSKYTQDRLEFDEVTIAISGTVSTIVDLIGKVPVGIIPPAALTGTAFTIQLSEDGSTFYNFYNTSGTQASITVAVDRWIGFTPGDFAGARYMKLVSGSTEAAERTITIVMRGM